MELLLMRHGATRGNELHRYVGRGSDEPLSEKGRAQCVEAGVHTRVRRVYVSPMLRTLQTAQLCFPNADLIPVPGLEEYDFGQFEGKSAQDMEHDESYRAWVDGWCMGRCPKGESRAEVVSRITLALEGLLARAAERGESRVVAVVHGGTIMAALCSLANGCELNDDYFGWQVGCCEGYSCKVLWLDGCPRLDAPRHVRNWASECGL